MAIVSKKCIRCRKPMRNDGTEQNPHWVCNNQNCVRYVPPTEKEHEQTEQVDEPATDTNVGGK